MDRTKPLAHMTPEEFRRTMLEQRRELLRTAPVFQCTCCREHKDRPEAEDAHIWEARPGPLAKHPMKGVPIYVLCRECAEKDPDVVYQRVAQAFIAAGLFGAQPTEEGRQLLGDVPG